MDSSTFALLRLRSNGEPSIILLKLNMTPALPPNFFAVPVFHSPARSLVPCGTVLWKRNTDTANETVPVPVRYV